MVKKSLKKATYVGAAHNTKKLGTDFAGEKTQSMGNIPAAF